MTPSSNFMEIIMKDINIRDLVDYSNDSKEFHEEFWKWLLDNYLTKERLGAFFLEGKNACDGVELASEVFARFAPTTHVEALITYISGKLYLLPDAKGAMQKMWKEIADATLVLYKKKKKKSNTEIKGHEHILAGEMPFNYHRAVPVQLSKYDFYAFESSYTTNIFVGGYAAIVNTVGRHRGTIFSYPDVQGGDFTFHAHCQNLILMGNRNIVKAMSVQNIIVCSGDENIIDFYNDGNQLYCYGDSCIISNKLSDLSPAAKSKIYVYGSGCHINLEEPVKYLYVAQDNEIVLRGERFEVPVKTFLVWKDGKYVPE